MATLNITARAIRKKLENTGLNSSERNKIAAAVMDLVDELNDVSTLVETVTAANTITAAESGKTFFLNSATEFVSTLPAPAAGLKFTFIVKAAPSGASYTIVTNGSSNIIVGHVVTSATGAADTETSGGDTISFVDGAAVKGDKVILECDGTNWYASCFAAAATGITITTAS